MFIPSTRPLHLVSFAALFATIVVAAPVEACEPAHAVARYEVAECKDQAPYSLCFAGPCKKKLGEIDALGRFAIVKPRSDWEVDFITWNTTNLTTAAIQQISVVDAPGVCGVAPVTVAGCTERYRIPNVKACAVGTMPPCPGNKVTATLSSLHQVNQATTPGGQVILDDGQVIDGRGRRRFWLHYEICCPDWGDFGKPGDYLDTGIDYTMRQTGIVTACVQASTRSTNAEQIPEQTFPCGDD
jgi:hypothetical protein